MKKVLFIFFLSFSFMLFANSADKTICKSLMKNKNLYGKTLAIIDFTDLTGRTNQEARYFTERLISRIASKGKIKIVERRQLNKILSEQSLTLSGLTQKSNLSKIGKWLNVDMILTGTLTKIDDKNEINARVIDVETGLILLAMSAEENSKYKNVSTEVDYSKMSDTDIEKTRSQYLNILKKHNVNVYGKIKKFEVTLLHLYKNNPKLFLLATEPPNSPRLKQIKHKRPNLYKKIQREREQWSFIVRNDRYLKAYILKLRRNLIKKIKK